MELSRDVSNVVDLNRIPALMGILEQFLMKVEAATCVAQLGQAKNSAVIWIWS